MTNCVAPLCNMKNSIVWLLEYCSVHLTMQLYLGGGGGGGGGDPTVLQNKCISNKHTPGQPVLLI